MATGTYSPDPFEQMCDDDGNPLSSGSLTVYAAGTTTPVNTYSDVNLTTPNTNPISLDAAGRPTSGAIFLTPGVSYKFILMDSLGATVATRDNIAAVPLNPNQTGTWTPVIGGSTSQSGQTYTFNSGTYTKLGTLVIANYQLQLAAKGSIVGNLQLKGLPFVNGTFVYTAPVNQWLNANTAFVHMSLVMNSGDSAYFFYGITAASASSTTLLTTTDITDTFQSIGTVIYNTTS